MCLKRVEKRKLLGRHNKDISLKIAFTNSCLITFKIMQKQPPVKFCKKAVLKNFAIFTGNTCVGDSFQFRIFRNFLEHLF